MDIITAMIINFLLESLSFLNIPNKMKVKEANAKMSTQNNNYRLS